MKLLDLGLIHPFMFGLLPILIIYVNNIAEISIESLLLPITIIYATTVVLLIVISKIIKNLQKSTLIVSFFLLIFFTIGYVQLELRGNEIFGFRADSLTVIGIPYIIFLLIGLYAIYKKTEMTKPNQIISVISIAVILSFLPTAISDSSGFLTNEFYEKIEFNVNEKPDVYLILLDGYAGERSLENNFRFDNSFFLDSLGDSNFYVSKNNFSNYQWSNLVMSSLLNMNYLENYPDYSVDDYFLLRDLYNHNLVMKTFQDNGYNTYFIDGGSPFREIQVSTETLCHTTDNGILQNLIDTSMISTLSKKFSTISWTEIRTCAFEELENIPNKSNEPKFTYAHINLPHHPYNYDDNGNLIEYSERVEELTEEESNHRYINQLKVTNEKVLELVQKIISSSENTPIIIITSDHGWGLQDLHCKEPCETDKRFLIQRYNNFQAVYPSNNIEFYDELTSVNLFRQILNDNFGTELELLENKAIFVKKDSITSNYISQIEITDIVKPKKGR